MSKISSKRSPSAPASKSKRQKQTAPADLPAIAGFQFTGIRCGIKEKGLDLALMVGDEPVAAAGVFTTSTVPGAPVLVSRDRVAMGHVRGVVVNSGCANVALGKRGISDAQKMAAVAARAVDCQPAEMLVASTGVIGEPLPLDLLNEGIPKAANALSEDGLGLASKAILTTDLVAKTAQARISIEGSDVNLVGIAKGSGMIEPNMATMLAFVFTDACATPAYLRSVLKDVTNDTFNRVSVDGEGSTSDMTLLFASGRAEHGRLTQAARGKVAGAKRFETALGEVCEQLAKAIARDGEGATKLIEVSVSGAASQADAELAARRIANSMLVKTAIFGGDPNWGRILQTVGAAGIPIVLERAEVQLAGIPLFQRGGALGEKARKAAEKQLSDREEVEITVHLGAGKAQARVWTCDLSYDYVRINAEYHT
ncbi:MAG: bifunctional glutamate N-acetyltransferase/amino-acid acetyltransferase ArgJ [Deltaproteobacteria bacterium]|nr:bifunctional glutamate N-acetyltransferase/amino-acid acetyltransferase ArgJ [Deltaproteobacteria bacterium]